MYFLKYSLILHLVFISVESKNEQLATVVGPQNLSVFERGLCVRQITKSDILNNYNSYYSNTSDNRVLTNVLGFIETPHQSSFKEVLTFVNKLSMLSPFKLEIRRIGSEKYDISGTGLIRLNKKWLQNVSKASQKDIKILPTVTFVDWKAKDFLALVASYNEIAALAAELLRVCQDNELHGLILDIWSEFYGKVPTNLLVMLIQEISARLRYDRKLALLLIPSMYANADAINRDMFEAIAEFVNYIILEVYDYSSAWNPGPNSPISIVEEFVKYLTPDPLTGRSSIFIGVNFFGNAYSSSGVYKITKDEYIDFLKEYDGEIQFDDEAMEHFFKIKRGDGQLQIYYPTVFSLHSRVRLANKLGVGVAVIELGQGLDYFYDLL